MWKNLLHKLIQKDALPRIVLVLGLAGMGCILLSSLPEKEKEEVPAAELTQAAAQAYRQELESQLTQLLGSIAGVGRVEVLVTVGGTERFHYAAEEDSLVSDGQIKSSSTYVTVGGSSSEKPLVESVSLPVITGVVVACEGAGKDTVLEAVYHSVAVSCGISTAQIYVTTLDGNVR